MRCLIVSLALLFLAFPAASGEVDALLGSWISPDGNVKSEFARTFEGDWITTRMWFKAEDDWRLVSSGAMYRRPGDERWLAVSRAREMGGIVLFESVFEFLGDGRVKVANTAYNDDGSRLLSEEDWQVSSDRIDYAIFEIIAGERAPLMTGEWKKINKK